jgi:pimeloyl-ACP methyl ester carboxylesterase
MQKIFIIHGWTYTTDKWQEFVGLMQRAGFEVVQLAVPGLTEGTDRVWTLEDYVEWLKDKLSAEHSPIVIGHSNGGRIALAFAAKYPDKIGKLILIDSAGIYHNELAIRIKRSAFASAARIGKKISSSPVLRKILYKLAGESDYKNAPPLMRKTMANLIAVDLTPQLAEIIIPTLIIWGRHDKATPLSDGQLMHKLIENSELYIIEGAGHSPHFTNAKEVSDVVCRFIGLEGDSR